MLIIAVGGVAPKTRKGRTATVRPSTKMLINSAADATARALTTQRQIDAPRIIATHWLRFESMEGDHG